MRKQRGIFNWLAVSLIAVALAGCSSDTLTGQSNGDTSGDANATEMSIDLGEPYGGLSSADEEPAFGDTYFAETLTEDEPVVTDEPPMDESRATVLFLRAVWGRVSEPPETPEDALPDCGMTIWDGGLSTTDGAIRPISTIRFERRGDYADSLLLPRDDRSTLEWTSITGCGRDGVVVGLIVPGPASDHGNGDGLTDDDMVTFETGPLTVSFLLKDVADLDTLLMVDADNGVAFSGFMRDDLDAVCRRGQIRGMWHEADGDAMQGGYFRAGWLNPVGELFGYVRGRYGVVDGRPVFRGKLINRNGGYEGHVVGKWERKNRRNGDFDGKWVVVHPDETPLVVGGLRGNWHTDVGGMTGWMRGRWSTRCADDDHGHHGGRGGDDGEGEGD